jgi:hypothetical protein
VSRTWSKASIGLGAAFILLAAVALWKSWGIWSTHIGYIFAGMLFIHVGITSIVGVTGQKVIRGLRFGFAGVGIVFLVIGLVTLIRS